VDTPKGYTQRIHPRDTNSMVKSRLSFTKAFVGSGMDCSSPPMHNGAYKAVLSPCKDSIQALKSFHSPDGQL